MQRIIYLTKALSINGARAERSKKQEIHYLLKLLE